ncbi:MAG TPA: CAP domain-containing protein [Miltoncostaea sp.]|nr:CAP domain-containing protein [Miltoncostaea sp.]
MAGLAVGLLIPTVAVAQDACKPAASPASERALVQMIAADRKSQKVGKVAKDPVLVKAGRKKSLQMARGGAFAHSSGAMAWAQGRSGAQNIAMAPTAALAMQAMLASPPHLANIRDGEWTITGVGAASDCNGQIFFTVNFAGPPAQ